MCLGTPVTAGYYLYEDNEAMWRDRKAGTTRYRKSTLNFYLV